MTPARLKFVTEILGAADGSATAGSLWGRFARGAVWSLIGAVLAQGGNLAASIVTARILGREQYGKFGMIQSTVGMLGVFAGAGLGLTATKFVAEYRARDPHRAVRIIALSSTAALFSGVVLGLALFVFASKLAARSLNAPELAFELRIASVMLFFNAVNGAQTGALAGFEAFRSIARINLLRAAVSVPATVAAVLLWGLPGAVWGLVIAAAVPCVVSRAALAERCAAIGVRPRFSSGWAERRVIWTFSTPAFLGGLLAGPSIWLANTMLVNQPGGYLEMGVLSAANQWRSAIAFIPGVLAQFALPLLSSLNGDRDGTKYDKAFRWNLGLTALTAAVVALPVAIGAPWIMALYGRGFREGTLVLAISAATAAISCVNAVVGTGIVSAGSVWVGFAFNAMWAAVFLLGCRLLVPWRLSVGLASAMLVAYLAHTLWQAVYLRRCLGRSRAT